MRHMLITIFLIFTAASVRSSSENLANKHKVTLLHYSILELQKAFK